MNSIKDHSSVCSSVGSSVCPSVGSSPFDKYKHTTVSMYLEPILNTYYKTYQNVITFSSMPTGPISEMVCTISLTKLSPFQSLTMTAASPFLGQSCVHVLCRYPCKGESRNFSMKQSDYYMGKDDISSVFSYLRENGYTIDCDLVKMMNKSRIDMGGVSDQRVSGDRKLICICGYREP